MSNDSDFDEQQIDTGAPDPIEEALDTLLPEIDDTTDDEEENIW